MSRDPIVTHKAGREADHYKTSLEKLPLLPALMPAEPIPDKPVLARPAPTVEGRLEM